MPTKNATGRELGELAWEQWGQHGVPVFPCKRSKAPLTVNGFHDAVTDYQDVIDLFERYGSDAVYIGAAMGGETGLFVIDFDTYKDGAEEFKRELEDADLLPDTRVHATVRGGLHYFYFIPDNEDTVGCPKPHKGVEIRGTGGYVIVPPSPGYGVVEARPVATAPRALVKIINKSALSFKSSSDFALEKGILEADNFHDALAMLAARHQARGEPIDNTTRKLNEIVNASVASNPHHPRHDRWLGIVKDDGRELSRIISSAYKKYNPVRKQERLAQELRKQRYLEHDDFDEGGEEEATPKKHPFERAYTLSELDQLDSDKGFLWYPLLMESDVLLIAAGAKAGKTLFAMTLCLHMAAGIPFGDIKPVGPNGEAMKLPVVYFALEGQGIIRQRVKAWRIAVNAQRTEQGLGPLKDEDVDILVVEDALDLSSPTVHQTVTKKLLEYNDQLFARGSPLGVQVVVIDTLTKAMPGKNQNTTEDTSAVFSVRDCMRSNGLDCALVYVHHTTHESGRPRGSTNILADPDTILLATKEERLVDGEPRDVVDVSVYLARGIDDTFNQKYVIESTDIGINRQGISMHSAVLYPTSLANDPTEMSDHKLEQAYASARSEFFYWLASDGLQYDIPMKVTALDRKIRRDAPESARTYYRKHKTAHKKNPDQMWKYICVEYTDDIGRLIYDDIDGTLLLTTAKNMSLIAGAER